MDHAIFFAREREAERLTSLVSVYRGTMLYGATGTGKSSLVNAGLLPRVVGLGFHPERVRVQPRTGEALVVERIPTADDGSEPLPSLLAAGDDTAARIVLSTAEFEQRVQAACDDGDRPLLVFDQFEELCTLFETGEGAEVRGRIVELLVRLLRSPLPVKLLFSFREDYLGKVKELLAACPELVDQSLQLTPLAADTLPTIVRGPFERYPGHFARELDPALAEDLRVALAERFGAGDLSLSEVQTVCLRLWQSEDPDRLLAEKGVQGLLEDYLGEALDAFPPQTRFAAIALLGQMVTAEGTRNVISAGDLVQRAREDDPALSPSLLGHALDRLDRESRLVRRERRRDLDLYEITSEFLVPWISRRREEARRLRERQRERRRILTFAAVGIAVLLLVAVVATVVARSASEARKQRDAARRALSSVEALALASASSEQADERPDAALLLGLGAYEKDPRFQSRDALMQALVTLRTSGAVAIMHGHDATASAVAVSPGGGRIASASYDGTVRLWSTRTHRQIGRSLKGHVGSVNDVEFSPDGRLLASGGDDGSVRLWDLATGRRSKLAGGQDGVFRVAFLPHGRVASVSWNGLVRVWDARARRQIGAPLHTKRSKAFVTGAAFSRDGKLLAIGSGDGAVRLWRLTGDRTPVRLPSGPSAPVYAAAFSPDGTRVAAGSDDGDVRLWDVATHRLADTWTGHDDAVAAVAFSRDGRTLASTGWDRVLLLRDVASGRLVKAPVQTSPDTETDVAFGPGRTLATAGVDGGVRLWSTQGENRFGAPLTGHRGLVSDVAFSHDGRLLASAGYDDEIRLWTVATRAPLGAPLAGHGSDVEAVAFSPGRPSGRDGQLLASASDDRTVRLWGTASRRQVAKLTGPRDYVFAVDFRPPDGDTVAAASMDGRVYVWDVGSRRLIETLRASKDEVYALAFSPDGAQFATGSDDGTIRLWDATSYKLLDTLRGHADAVNAVAFSPDGSRLASAGVDGSVRRWDLAEHRQIGQPLRDHENTVFDVAFSRDGSLLASAGADNNVRLWSARYGTPLGTPLTGHWRPVRAVAFSPDGTTLASASRDGTVRLWPGVLWRSFGDLRAEVCRIVGASLTRDEWARYVPSVPYRRTCPE